jgi:hypothetical protein
VASSLWVCLLLPVVHASLGSIYPNFAAGNDPEKVSTSSMGMVTLIISSSIALVLALSLDRYMTGAMSISAVWGIHLFVSVLAVFILVGISRNFIGRYEF